jgi:transcriptional regulator with XRE-family HTH domain
MHDSQSPERCHECGVIEVYPDVIPYTARVKHDGSLHTFAIARLRVLKCRSCGDVLFDNTTDEQISDGLRRHLGLLSPQEIRRRLGRLDLTQKEFGERICVAPETISRWLSGTYIQSRASNRLMELFFEREEARQLGSEAVETTLPHGELASWSQFTYYQEENDVPDSDSVVDSAVTVPGFDLEMLVETSRGPPAREAAFLCLAL